MWTEQPRNANLLVWHRKLYPIDHGAALFFHHDWPTLEQKIESPFPQIGQHILLPWASEIKQASAIAHAKLAPQVLTEVIDQVPNAWLESIPGGLSAAQRKAGYLDFFLRRLSASHIFEQEAIDARTRLV